MEKQKKRDVSELSAEAEYRAMSHTMYELLTDWVWLWAEEFHAHANQSVIYIAKNNVFYDSTKHIEIDYHLVRDYLMKKVFCTLFTLSSKQLNDILIKAISSNIFLILCDKLDMIDIYTLS